MVVRDRQRIAVDPVAGLELALEVRAPQVVGESARRGGRPGWPIARRPGTRSFGTTWAASGCRTPSSAPATPSSVGSVHQRNQLLRRPTAGGDGASRGSPRSPAGRRGLIRTPVRSARSLRKSCRALLKVALDQSVAGLVAHAVAAAQSAGKEKAPRKLGQPPWCLLVHRRGLGSTAGIAEILPRCPEFGQTVSHVPAWNCQRCPRDRTCNGLTSRCSLRGAARLGDSKPRCAARR